MRSAMTKSAVTIYLFPRNVVIAVLLLYRRFISPLYGDVCRFYPTCSAYALQAVQRFGVIRGGVLAAWRLLRCNPFNLGGVDHVPPSGRERRITRLGFVVA